MRHRTFQMTPRKPYWCSYTIKWRLCWCSEQFLWELSSFLRLVPSRYLSILGKKEDCGLGWGARGVYFPFVPSHETPCASQPNPQSSLTPKTHKYRLGTSLLFSYVNTLLFQWIFHRCWLAYVSENALLEVMTHNLQLTLMFFTKLRTG